MTSPVDRSPAPRKRWKKILFAGLAGGISLVFLELLSYLALQFVVPTSAPPIKELHDQQDVIAKSGRGTGTAQEILHPYFGWALDPETNPGCDANGEHFPVNRFGFVDSNDSLQKREPGKVIIGIFGGSFAHEFGILAHRRFEEQLANDPRFAGKEIVLVRLGVSGFKQPQNLLILSYLLGLGGEFDYIINLDGFNEVVLTETGNLPSSVNYSYPHQWHIRLEDVVTPSETSTSYRLLGIRARRQEVAASAAVSRLRWSGLYCLIWKCRDLMMQRELISLGMAQMNRTETDGRGFVQGGPRNPSTPIEQLRTEFVDLWKRCSREMKVLAAANGAEYYQFLQPNQYLPDSKVLTPDERETAYAPGHSYEKAVQASYPLLQQAGAELQSDGIRFVDLTGIFRNETGTIYRDWCCHVNQKGYEMVADAMAQAIIRSPSADSSNLRQKPD
jgi:hypothetical protein